MKELSKRNKFSSRIQGYLHKERIRSATSSGYPKVKAKESQTRQLMPYALALAQRFQCTSSFCDPRSLDDWRLQTMLRLVCHLEDVWPFLFHRCRETQNGYYWEPDANDVPATLR